MDNVDSPVSSDSAHTPLQDEHINCKALTSDEPVEKVEIGDLVEMAEEQLDYEEFIDNGEEPKVISEAEDGECDSDDNVVDSATWEDITDKAPLSAGEVVDDLSINPDTECITGMNEPLASGELPSHTDFSDTKEELAEGELKAEEEEPLAPETPWERGLRLARERRELAKLKKVQEKDNLKERQLHLNLDGIEEVEPIIKPLVAECKELNPKLLKALQPIVILAENPKENEMTLEYYLAEADYQQRPRFIPSKLYTLDPWEVDEWKRELDMIKFENELASNRLRRPGKRPGRRSSGSSSASSRSSTSAHGRPMLNIPNRNYEHNTSQFALNRNRGSFNPNKKPQLYESNDTAQRRGKRDLPPEFKNRVPSSSRSSSRSSSGSHSSSSSSSSSSSNSSRHSAPAAAIAKQRPPKVNRPQFQGVKKPALGRARSNSSASSSSSNSSSSSSGSSDSSQSSTTSNRSKKPRKAKTDKKFISSWTNKSKTAQLATTIVPESGKGSSKGGVAVSTGDSGGIDMDRGLAGAANGGMDPSTDAIMAGQDNDELPSATSRPGVKLKLVSRSKPVMMSSQGTPKKPSKMSTKDKVSKKDTTKSDQSAAAMSQSNINVNTAASGIFNNSKSIFSTQKSGDIPMSSKDSTLKSDLVTTQMEMQQEFLRNYKDKIAIYRSQLSYQQHNSHGQGIYTGTLTHAQPPPLKGPITVMSVTSKKTGPPKPATVKLADHYSQYEEHQSRHNHHQSPNYRTKVRHGSRNRSRSFEENNNSNRGGKGFFDKGRNMEKPRNEYRDGRSFNENSAGKGRELYDRPRNDGGDRGREGYENKGRGDWERGREFLDKSRGEGDRGRDFYDRNRGEVDRGREIYDKERGRGERGRNEGERGRNEGDRGRNEMERGRNEGERGRNEMERGRNEGERGRNEGDRGRNEMERGRNEGERGRNEMDRGRNDGEHGRFDLDRGRNEGIRGRGGRDEMDRGRYNKEDKPRRDFERNKEIDKFVRDDRPRDRLRDMDSDRNRDLDKRFDQNKPPRPDLVNDKTNIRSQKRDRDPLDLAVQNNHVTEETGASKLAPSLPVAVVSAVPKEKRREELLKQLKAVEDAIAKKKAKIDK